MNRILLITLVVLSCLLGWVAYLSHLENSYIFNDDARIVLLGVLRFFDSNLFPNYLIADYAEVFVTPGVRTIYWICSALFPINPIALSKIIPFFLFVISAVVLLKLMYTITSSQLSSVLAVLFFISISTFKLHMTGGYPRSFSVLLVLCFLYFLIKKSWIKLFITLALSSLLNPITFLLCYGTFFLSSISISIKPISISIDREKRRLITLLTTILFGALVLIPQHLFDSSPNIGKTMNREQVISESVYYQGGRPGSTNLPTPNVFKEAYQSMISPFMLNTKAKLIDNNGFSKEKSIATRVLFIIVILFVLINIKRGSNIIPKEMFCYLLCSMILYVIADIFLIKLYFPNRYVTDMRLISFVIVFLIVSMLLKQLRSKQTRPLYFLFISFVVLITFLSSDFTKSIGMKDYSSNKPIFDYVSTLPKDVMLAAYPMGIADNIPLCTKRKVFIFYEASNPFHDKYWDWVKGRTTSFFDAYYAEQLVDVYKFMEINKIDYLIVNKKHFQRDFLKNDKTIYFLPFSQHISEIITNRNNFALSEISTDDQDFNWEDKYVISREKINDIIENRESKVDQKTLVGKIN